jgi:hypothetical protein
MISINRYFVSRYFLLIMSVLGFATLTIASAQSASITSDLCNIVNNIRSVVGIVSLALFVLGGAFYAVAHMLPAAGNLKGNLQGWSLGMIVGGIVGLIIVIVAPYIISLIASSGGLNTGTNC